MLGHVSLNSEVSLVLSMSTHCWKEGFSNIFNCHFRPCQLHDGVFLTHHAIFSHTIFFSISTHPKCPSSCPLPSPSTPPLPTLALGSGTGQLPVVWSLPSVVGTFIRQRTLRSFSMTRHPWWMATRSSSAWRRPGASCPFLSSPSSTISTGEHLTVVVGK